MAHYKLESTKVIHEKRIGRRAKPKFSYILFEVSAEPQVSITALPSSLFAYGKDMIKEFNDIILTPVKNKKDIEEKARKNFEELVSKAFDALFQINKQDQVEQLNTMKEKEEEKINVIVSENIILESEIGTFHIKNDKEKITSLREKIKQNKGIIKIIEKKTGNIKEVLEKLKI